MSSTTSTWGLRPKRGLTVVVIAKAFRSVLYEGVGRLGFPLQRRQDRCAFLRDGPQKIGTQPERRENGRRDLSGRHRVGYASPLCSQMGIRDQQRDAGVVVVETPVLHQFAIGRVREDYAIARDDHDVRRAAVLPGRRKP